VTNHVSRSWLLNCAIEYRACRSFGLWHGAWLLRGDICNALEVLNGMAGEW
jgi:hypothetical protein